MIFCVINFVCFYIMFWVGLLYINDPFSQKLLSVLNLISILVVFNEQLRDLSYF